MIDNKKGQGLPITTIILIILGVVVLVILIIGFTQGWGTLRGWFTGGVSTERYVSECAVACSTQNLGGWCDKKYTIEGFDDKQSCAELVTQDKIVACLDTAVKCPGG